jgi:hypothetical protein
MTALDGRIGKVRWKAKNVTSIYSPPGDDIRQTLIEDARDAAAMSPGQAMLGYVVIAWTEHSRFVNYRMADDWAIGGFTLHELAKDAVLHKMEDDAR